MLLGGREGKEKEPGTGKLRSRILVCCKYLIYMAIGTASGSIGHT